MSVNAPLDAVVHSIVTAERHIETEFREDLPATLASVSGRPRYAMTPKPGQLDVVTTPEGVRDFYEGSRSTFQPMATRHRLQIATDWYVFYEGVPSRLRRDTGQEYTINTVVLFPATEDGIVGEFLWERYDEAAQPAGQVDNGPAYELPLGAVRSLRLHESYLAGLRAADIEGVRELLAEDCLWATRNYLDSTDNDPMVRAEGRIATLEHLTRWTGDHEIVDVSVINRYAADWYVFAEELYTVRTRSGPDAGVEQEYRLASVYPVTGDGLLQGLLGYGTDQRRVDTPRVRLLGHPIWARENHPDPWLARVQGSADPPS